MDIKKTLNTVWIELISNGIGWLAGLLAADLVSLFFIRKKWSNAWGAFSDKNAVDQDTYGVIEWLFAAVIGYLVLVTVNRFAVPYFFKPVLERLRLKKKETIDA